MSWRVSWSAALALVVLLFSSQANASRVRFISEASESFNRRVVAELENAGFDVDETTRVEEPLPEGSVAIVHATNEPPQVEVWLVESAERVQLSNVIERDLRDDDADSTRVAERLRALLQPLVGKSSATLPPAPEPVVEPPPAESPPSAPIQPALTAWQPAPLRPVRRRAPEPSVFGVEAGALVHSQPESVAFSFLLGARWDFAHPFGARVFGALPIRGTSLHDGDASADLDARMVGLTIGLELLPAASDLRVFVGLGGGVVWLHASGNADPPLRTRSVDDVAGLVHVNASMTYVVGNDFTLGLGAMLGLALPRTDIAFAGERVGTWGRPLLGATLALGYDF